MVDYPDVQPESPEPTPMMGVTPQPASPEQRRAALAQAVAREVASGGRVESQSEIQAIIVHGKRVNHTLHLILTLVTLTVWSWVWLILWILGGEKRIILTVDDYGNVLRQKASKVGKPPRLQPVRDRGETRQQQGAA